MWHPKTVKPVETESYSGGCQGLGNVGNRERLAEGQKLLVVRWIKPEDLLYNMVTIVDNSA